MKEQLETNPGMPKNLTSSNKDVSLVDIIDVAADKSENFDETIDAFLAEQLMPFHGMISLANMNKETECMELDSAIEKLGQICTLLGLRKRRLQKENKWGI